MKKKINILKEYFKVNKKMFLFFEILLLIGVLSGSIFSLTLNETDAVLVSEYLNNFIESISNNSYKDALLNAVLSNSLILTIIFLLGFSVIGIPFVILIFFYKAFIIGFSFASIILNFKSKGILLSFFYIFPHHALNLLVLMVLIIYSVLISLNLIRAIISKTNINTNNIKYLKLYLLSMAISFLSSLYESILMPKIIYFIFCFLK
jgi:stage II sporulation protein M